MISNKYIEEQNNNDEIDLNSNNKPNTTTYSVMLSSFKTIVALIFAMSPCSIWYGYTAYNNTLLDHFYPGESWSMRNGGPIYVGGLGVLTSCAVLPLISTKLQIWGLRRSALIGTIIAVIGCILCALSITLHKLWLLYIGFGVFVGIGGVMINVSGIFLSIEWFSQIGKQGLGIGLYGLFAGLWAAAYPYIVGGLIKTWSISGAFYGTGIIIAILVGFTSIVWPSMWITPKANKIVDVSSNKSRVNGDPSGAFKLTHSQLLHDPLFWYYTIALFLILLPGFGIKYTTYVLMKSVFLADESTQQLASMVFLLIYALTRLSVGIFLDSIPIKRWWTGIIIIQILTCTVLGFLIYFPTSASAYITISIVLGGTFAATKVVFVATITPLYGQLNIPLVFGMVVIPFGSAAFLGPISMWAALTQFRMNGEQIVVGVDVNRKGELAVAIWYWSSAAVTALAGLILLPEFKPFDFKKFNKSNNTNSDGSEGGGYVNNTDKSNPENLHGHTVLVNTVSVNKHSIFDVENGENEETEETRSRSASNFDFVAT